MTLIVEHWDEETDGVAEAFLALGAHERVRDGDGEWSGMVFDFINKQSSVLWT